MDESSNKKPSKYKEPASPDLTKKIRAIMEEVKFQAKLQERINPKKRTYQKNFEESGQM